ncbi:MAG TPA: 23S rRNA (uracil(1939)-C(5))-methyltransferase RlmD [Kofleriaceae bacterium]|jgi:23S rRNA (uracil1939-C5)-methyltransferase|nr:23S rRNA (uracil(1939)-C(5))-methyltransferase RlmD [Kofleriaceae bacterium]
MAPAKPNRCEVEATALDDGGAGVGPVIEVAGGAELAVHVGDLLPGERAEVVIDHRSPHRPQAWARLLKRIGPPSPERVPPVCPGFGRCGGCVWQHLAYPAQLAAKRDRVVAALAELPAVAAGGVEIAQVRPSPERTGYRNKGKYVCGHSGDHLVLGAYAPRSHEVVDTLGCRVVAPIIDEVATWVRGAAERAELAAYSERERTGELRYVIVREAAGDVMVVLVVAPRTPRAKLDRVAATLANHPAVHSVVVVENDRRDGAIVPSGASATVLHGHGHLVESLAGAAVEVGAGEFLQVNRAQAAAMYARVTELAEVGSATQAIDLFAGLGGIGLHLARAGATVIAVEIDRDAVAQLRRAAQHAGLRLTAIAGDAGDVRGQLGARPDVVVVNPPRKGLSAGARAFLAELAAPTVIYVSCGPEALGRDLTALAGSGYTPDAIEPFDLMPGTAQVETLVRLRRPVRAGRRAR